MARSLMTLLCVRLELAYHMSYCLLHLHIHFDSHTQRRRKANDYFARVGCRSVNPSHYANGLCVNRLDMAAGDKHRLKVFWLDDSDRGLFSLSHAYLPLRGRRGRGWPKREANKNLAFASPLTFDFPWLAASASLDPPKTCGRFDNLIGRDAYRGLFKAQRLPKSNYPLRYTICSQIPIARIDQRDGEREVIIARWGLIPFWMKEKPTDPCWTA